AVYCQGIEIRQSQLAGGTVGLKEDHEGLLPGLVTRNSRCDSGLRHESQDAVRSDSASDLNVTPGVGDDKGVGMRGWSRQREIAVIARHRRHRGSVEGSR